MPTPGPRSGRPAPTPRGAGVPPTVVSGADWEGRDLSGERHEGVTFYDLDATDAVNGGAVFTACTFHNAVFTDSAHRDAAFLCCTLFACTFLGVRFVGVRFVDCNLAGSTADALAAAVPRRPALAGTGSRPSRPSGSRRRSASRCATRIDDRQRSAHLESPAQNQNSTRTRPDEFCDDPTRALRIGKSRMTIGRL